MHVTILQPYRPDTPPALIDQAMDRIDDLIAAHPEHRVTVVRGPATADAPGRYGPHAAVRNAMLMYVPLDADAVLWVDVDLIAYPATFIAEALARNPGGITAPVVTLDHSPDRFYDIGGFIAPGGVPFTLHAPWCDQPDNELALESVGCMYLAPAHIYRDWGLRYAPTGPVYGVEHYSVCKAAADRGVPVRAYRDLVAVHAWLPDYGKECQ